VSDVEHEVTPEAAERVDAAVDALLGGRAPRGYAAPAEELEALRGAALRAGARDDVAEAQPEFVAALEMRLRAALGTGAAGAEPPAAAPRAPDAGAPAEPAEIIPIRRTGRRGFLISAGAAAAAAAAGVVGDRLVRGDGSGGYASNQNGSAELQPQNATWRDVASLASVTTAGPVRFSAGAIEGVLVATPDGGVKAYSAVCTHMGCLLDVARTPDRLVCPCHNATFGLDGTPNTANYIPLPRLPWLHSRVSGDRVEVLA
jgi:nitrite reductase/ring-hydroxylating ferredoxin subunit